MAVHAWYLRQLREQDYTLLTVREGRALGLSKLVLYPALLVVDTGCLPS